MAKSLKLMVVNPEVITIGQLSSSLDARKNRRRVQPLLKVVCSDCITGQPLGSTSTVDFCEGGICGLING